MRVTAQAQAVTRQRILEVAQHLFVANGFEATTTRDIAREAKIGVGTLFNYFPNKESVVACLVADAVTGAHRQFGHNGSKADSFEEDLFTFVAAGLRKLKPLRKNLPAVLETTLSPLVASTEEENQSIRVSHLESVNCLAGRHGYQELTPVALQMYWALYTGLLMFWANDPSPRQEDTLALLDHSLEMFVGWLHGQHHDSRVKS